MSLYALLSLGLKDDNFGKLMMIFIILALIISVLLYGALTYTKIAQDGTLPVATVLALTSLSLLALSIIFFYITTYWNKYREITIGASDSRSGVEAIKEGLI